MERFFLELLNMSITASFLMVLVISLHYILRGMPKNINCVLWLLVGIRLICPVSIESAFSVLPGSEPVRQIIDNASGGIAPAANTVNAGEIQTVPTANKSQPMKIPPESKNVYPVICAAVWLAGVAAMSVYTMLCLYKLKKRVNESIPYRQQVFLCDNIDTPFIFGILHPKIYIPSDISEEQMPYVLQHEKAHLKRSDPLWKIIGYMILIVHWFNPFVWISYKLFCKDIELACDEKVIRNLGSAEKKKYSITLLEYSVKGPVFSLPPLAFGEISVKERVKAILDYKKPAFWTILFAIVICLAVGIGFLTNPVTEKGYSDEELVSMAAEYYLRNSGRDYLYLPEFIEVSAAAEDGQRILSLYDIIMDGEEGGRGVTWAVYQVDHETAAGYETRGFDAVDLTRIEASHDFNYYLLADREGVWQLDIGSLDGIETNPGMENNGQDKANTDSGMNGDTGTGPDQARAEVLERLHSIPWEELEARELTFTGELSADLAQIQCIGEIPEYQIKLYGYGDEDYQGMGAAVQIGGDVNFFDWVYTSPRGLPPAVYWNDKDKILQTSLKIYTGTGVSAEELHVLQQYETGTLDDAIFAFDDYSSLLQEMIGYQYLEEEKKLQLVKLSDRSILSEIENIDEPGGIASLELGMISSFILGDDILLQVAPGYLPNGQVTAEYEGMPMLVFPVYTVAGDGNNTLFRLGEPQVGSLGDEPQSDDNVMYVTVEGEEQKIEATRITDDMGFAMNYDSSRFTYTNASGQEAALKAISQYVTAELFVSKSTASGAETIEELKTEFQGPVTVTETQFGADWLDAVLLTETDNSPGITREFYIVEESGNVWIIQLRYSMEAAEGLRPILQASMDSVTFQK